MHYTSGAPIVGGMAKAMGSATIWLGRVAIPVRVYPAILDPPRVAFHYLHWACNGRVRQEYHCPRCEERTAPAALPRDALHAGVEVGKDQYVTFSKEERQALTEEPDPAIEIGECVPAESIDPIHWARPHYLGPEPGHGDGYALLVDALHLSGRVGLAHWRTRGADLFVAVRESGRRLVVQELLRAEEVRPIAEIEAPPAPAAGLAKLGLALVTRYAGTFDPAAYPDRVYARTVEAVEAKRAGKEIIAVPAPGREAPLPLAAALKASIEAGKPRGAKTKRGRT